MEIKVCKNCRRLFNYIFGSELCPECSREIFVYKMDEDEHEENTTLNPNVLKEEEKFEQVKLYIERNPKASVAKIVEDNDIALTKIFEWIKEGRLQISEELGES